MKWFRFYPDLPHDRKLREFNSQQKWAWVVLLCLASKSKERGYILGEDEEVLAEDCGFDSVQDFQFFLDKLRQQNMIEPIKGGLKITSWEYDQKYRDRPPIAVWRELRQRVFSRDNYTCQYCGVYGAPLQCDHVFPVSRGGSSDISNLVTSCKTCNQSKHDRTPEEWRSAQ